MGNKNIQYDKQEYVVHTILLPTAILFTIGFPIFIFLYAAYYGVVQQFSPFLWICPLVGLLSFIGPIGRNTKINNIDKTVEIRDGGMVHVVLLPGEVKSISKTKLGYKITVSKKNKIFTYDLQFAFYTERNRRKVVDAILKFNPEAVMIS